MCGQHSPKTGRVFCDISTFILFLDLPLNGPTNAGRKWLWSSSWSLWIKCLFLEQVAFVECERPLRHQRTRPLGLWRRANTLHTRIHTLEQLTLVRPNTSIVPDQLASRNALYTDRTVVTWSVRRIFLNNRFIYAHIGRPSVCFCSMLGLVPDVKIE